MAVDYGVKLGFAPGALIKALLLVQFIGFPAAVAYGWLADRVGTRRMIYVGLLIYGAVTVGSYWLKSESDFYLLAAAIGLVHGGEGFTRVRAGDRKGVVEGTSVAVRVHVGRRRIIKKKKNKFKN